MSAMTPLAYNRKMHAAPLRFVAVDWSGAKAAAQQRRRIVVADWREGAITLSTNRTREETMAWIVQQAPQTPAMVVGMDFSFSLPAWFVRQCTASSAVPPIENFWQIAAASAESWLDDCAAPFWGRPAKRCPAQHRAPLWRGYRQCEMPSAIGWHPSSTFQIGGAGAVGTGSLRGFSTLLALRGAGFAIWPFHPPTLPLVVEIYPRTFTGAVHKSNAAARAAYLQRPFFAKFSREAVQIAAASEDAFDAFCSVIGMAQQQAQFAPLKQTDDPERMLEGDIFPGRPILADESLSRFVPELLRRCPG